MNKNILIKNNYKNKIAASALIFILAASALIYFIIMPSVNEIKTKKVKIGAQSQELEKNYTAGKSLNKLTENLRIVEPQLNKLEQSFIKEEAGVDFVSLLEKTAAENNVQAAPPRIREDSALGQTYGRKTFFLETKGPFPQQIKYLQALESLNYYLNVKTLELNTQGSGEASKTIDMLITADTYWQNSAAAAF